jgi:CRISPR-associated DxTHG motif protein
MKKIITFLGKYPKETQYSFAGQVFTGRVFAEALHQFTTYDRMLVFITEEAKESSWPVVEELGDVRIQPVLIPIGETTEQMWVIFDRILEFVDEEDTVIFDITHGLRSTPFLMFLFAAFLKFARNVMIEAVYYGAFELGNPKDNIPAPVIDLSEFVNMLDWISATDRFISTGDGGTLTGLLRDEMPPGIQMKGDLAAREIGKHLRSAANGIEKMSQALQMARPFEAMLSGAEISKILKVSKNHISVATRPFEALVDKIENSYGQFGLETPLDPEFALPSLTRQLGMVGWYLDHEQAVQAIWLMRELLISAFMAICGLFPFTDREKRVKVEQSFNKAAYARYLNNEEKTQESFDELSALPDPVCVITNWQKLTQMRNDIAHCAHRESAQSAADLVFVANRIYEATCQIANELLSLLI